MKGQFVRLFKTKRTEMYFLFSVLLIARALPRIADGGWRQQLRVLCLLLRLLRQAQDGQRDSSASYGLFGITSASLGRIEYFILGKIWVYQVFHS